MQRNAPSRAKSVECPRFWYCPFGVAGRSTKTDYFSEGITNDIITGLSKFSELLVIASHTAFSSEESRIAFLNWVSSSVSGTLLKALSSAQGKKFVLVCNWSRRRAAASFGRKRLQRPAQEIFQLQDEIVETVVGTLIARLDRSENRRVLHKEPNDLETYDVYLQGRAAWRQWTRQSNLQA